MDLSAFIFAGLAVAWAVYLVPKLLKHHDEVVRSRSAEKLSRSMRVLAHREAVDARNARLVVGGAAPAADAGEGDSSTAVSGEAAAVGAPGRTGAGGRPADHRASARRAVRRRRRVLGLVLLANAVVGGLAVAKVIDWPWVLVPVGLLVAWLVACRLMVKGERAARASAVRLRAGRDSGAAVPAAPAAPAGSVDAGDPTGTTSAVQVLEVGADSPLVEAPAASTGEFSAVDEPADGLWDPVPTTLPTYVSKPAAVRRTVETIDLDSTGVWSSGRNEIDSALAREAEAAEKDEKIAEAVRSERRVSGA